MEKLKQIRDDRIKFVETTLEDAKRKEEDLTSKEIQALKKLIDGNIQIIRSHSDKIISLSSNETTVLKAIKGSEKRILDIQNRVEMLSEGRDDIRITQHRAANELKLWKQTDVSDLNVGDQICYKDGRNKFYIGKVTQLTEDTLKVKEKDGNEHTSKFDDEKSCWRKSENEDEENADLRYEHIMEIIKDLKI